MFPEKSGGLALYAHEAWRKYTTLVGPIATFGYWIGWSVVLSVNGLFIGSIIQSTWFSGEPGGSYLADDGYFSVLGLTQFGLPAAIAIVLILGVWLFNIFGARVGVLFGYGAGVLLMVFRPFRVGQYVEVAGVAGTVQEVSLMHTRLLSPDNREIVLPNSKVAGDAIVNHSARGTRRIDLVVGIGYGDDLGRAIAVVRELIAADGRVLAEPAPDVAVAQLGESAVQIAIRPWVNTGDAWAVQTSLLRAVKERFDAEGIRIPTPPREIVMLRDPPVAPG
jgi:small conductance mechanosensitive channel